jgi:hypothetical protein
VERRIVILLVVYIVVQNWSNNSVFLLSSASSTPAAKKKKKNTSRFLAKADLYDLVREILVLLFYLLSLDRALIELPSPLPSRETSWIIYLIPLALAGRLDTTKEDEK